MAITAVTAVDGRTIWAGTCDKPRDQGTLHDKKYGGIAGRLKTTIRRLLPTNKDGFSFSIAGSLVKKGNSIRFYEKESGKELEFSPFTFEAADEAWVAQLVALSNLPLIHVMALNEVKGALLCNVMLVGGRADRSSTPLIAENAEGAHVIPASQIRFRETPEKGRPAFWFAEPWPDNHLRVDVTEYFRAPKKDDDTEYVTLKVLDNGKTRFVSDERDLGRIPEGRIRIPPEENAKRVQTQGTMNQKFTTFAYSNYRAYRSVFAAYASRPWKDIDHVLDWGCGCGRVTQHVMHSLGAGKVFGADVDSGNVNWCLENLGSPNFVLCDTKPPMSFPDGTFDYIIGTSVFTHIPEELVEPWLAELRRVLKPGGLAALTVGTETRVAFGSYEPDRLRKLEERGIEDSIRNSQLKGFVKDEDYYRNVRMTKAYIRRVWSRHLKVIEILDHGIGVQDIVICQRVD